MKPRHRRLLLILIFGGFIATAVGVVLYNLKSSVTYFYTPYELSLLSSAPDKPFRLGGMVKEGSYKNTADGGVMFDVGDRSSILVTVAYKGLLPDLFREGQGVIVEGKLDEKGTFIASQVLAKHDENYMPPQLEKSLKEQGMKPDFAPMSSKAGSGNNGPASSSDASSENEPEEEFTPPEEE